MAESLPIEIKIRLIDTLLNSIHPSQSEIDELWEKKQREELIRLSLEK